jgi:hypothetical protein
MRCLRFGDGLVAMISVVGLVASGCAPQAPTTYERSVLVEGSHFHGIHGITVGPLLDHSRGETR